MRLTPFKTLLLISLLLTGFSRLSLAQHRSGGRRDFSKPGPKTLSLPGLPLKPDSSILTGVLPNGMHYYIRQNAEPHKRAELRLVVNAGSVLEDEDQLGAAHFVEHLLFNGTKNFRKNELVTFLERAGLQFGADLNASTGFDETVYKLTVPTDSSRLGSGRETIFQTSFQILADWAAAASFDETAIDKERGIITEEWRLGRGASARMRDRYFKKILQGSRYALRLPIGTRESIAGMSHAAIRRFYQDWYRPDLMAVVAVGDFDQKTVQAQIIQAFASIPRRTKSRQRISFGIPDNKDLLAAVETDPEQVYNIVQVYFKQPQAVLANTQDLHEELSRDLFNIMIQARLGERSREPNPPFLYGAAAYGQFLGKTDIYQAFAVAKNGAAILPALQTLVDENSRIRSQGFSKSEFDRAKESLLAAVDKYYAERDKTPSAAYVQPLSEIFLRGSVLPSAAFRHAFSHSEVPAISLTEVNRLASQLMRPYNQIALVLAPEKEKASLPGPAEIKAAISKARTGLSVYKDDVSALPLLRGKIATGTVLSQTMLPQTSITDIKLSNGMRILVRPGNSTNDQVLFSGFAKGGASSFQGQAYRDADFSSDVLSDAGLGAFNAIQLEKKLAGKNVHVRAFVDEYQQGLSGSSTVKDLETAFKLVHLWFSHPSEDSSHFKDFVNREAEFIANRLADPGYVFTDTVNAVLSGHNPRKRFATPADIRSLSFARSLALFKSLFADPSAFTFVFTGNAEPAAIAGLAAEYLGGLHKQATQPRLADDLRDYPQGPLSLVLKKGKEERSQVRIYYTGKTAYDTSINTRLSVITNALEIRLRQILREDKGAVYGVGVDGSVSKIPRERYRIAISFACAPKQAEALVSAVQTEVESLKTKGVDSLTLEKVKAEFSRTFETRLRENAFWLQAISEGLFFDENLSRINRLDAEFKAVSAAQTKELAQRFFKNEGRLVFRLDPGK